MHISKFDDETNPDHWFEDYRHAMRAGGFDDNFVV
jgi:hypothetical protein